MCFTEIQKVKALYFLRAYVILSDFLPVIFTNLHPYYVTQ
jgi:hypothetical protein